MPEKIEVLFFSKKIKDMCQGKKLLDIIIHKGPYLDSEKEKYSEFRKKANEFSIHKVEDVKTKGKYMYFLLSGKYHALTVHHGMEGSWCTDPNNKHIIMELKFEERSIYFQDSRRFGTFDLLDEADFEMKLLDIGPDAFFEIKSYPELYAMIALDNKVKKKKLCDMLLDQTFISGIGNYLRADIMYHSGLHPEKHVGTLTEEDMEKLFWSMKSILKKCYEQGGTTTGKYNSSIHTGNYQFLIYGKKTSPLGEKIESFKDKQKRTVWWVPLAKLNHSE